MSIYDLPEELLSGIFANLEINVSAELSPRNGYPSTERQKLAALASVSLVNRAFHRVAAGHLYKTLYVPHGKTCNTHLDLYLRTLISNPALAPEVKNIHVQGWKVPEKRAGLDYIVDPRPWQTQTEIFEREARIAVAKRTAVGPTTMDELLEGLSQGRSDADALLLLLLLICPNIDFLDLIPPEASSLTVDALEYLSATASHTHAPLQRPALAYMRSLRIQNDATSRLGRLKTGSLDRPSLKVFRGERVRVTSASQGLTGPGKKDSSSALSEMYLQSCHLVARELDVVLCTYRHLQVLDIQWTDLVQHELDFDEMGRSLRHMGINLRRLTLDPTKSPTFVHGLHEGCLGSLQELSQLRNLRVPLSILLYRHVGRHDHGHYEGLFNLFSVLPESIATLQVICPPNPIFPDTPPPVDPVRALHRVLRDDRLPRLKRIDIALGVQDHKLAQIEREVGIQDDEASEINWTKVSSSSSIVLIKRSE